MIFANCTFKEASLRQNEKTDTSIFPLSLSIELQNVSEKTQILLNRFSMSIETETENDSSSRFSIYLAGRPVLLPNNDEQSHFNTSHLCQSHDDYCNQIILK